MSSNSPRPTEPADFQEKPYLRGTLRALQQLSIPALMGQLALEMGI